MIALASVGLPGFAAFDARTELAQLALDQPFSIALVVATLAPLIWYGRLFVIGVLRPDRVLEPVDAWRPRIGSPGPDGIRRWLADTWDRNRAFTTASVAGLLAIFALATAVGGFDARGAAGGPPPVIGEPVESAAAERHAVAGRFADAVPVGGRAVPVGGGSPSRQRPPPAASPSRGVPVGVGVRALGVRRVAPSPSPSAVVPSAAP